MRPLNYKFAFAAAILLTVAAWGQRPYFLVPGVHPGYSLVNMKPASAPAGQPNVGAMAWLPDGRLFVAGMSTNAAGGTNANRLGPTSGYIFAGLLTATAASAVTMTAAGDGYQMPSGAVTVGDTIYVVDNDSGLTRLTPNGSGGYVKKVIYSGVLGYLTGKSGSSYRSWTGGLVYKDGFFYAVVGMGLIPGGTSEYNDANLYRGKGTILKISKAGQVVDTVAGGVRNPVSFQLGPDQEMFYTDNQGSFMPASAMFHVKQGRFFGHLKTPYDTQRRTAPAIIFPYGSDLTGGTASNPCVSRVATGWVQLRAGRFAGQLLIGSNPQNGINRIFMEKVDGVYQGAIFPFSQGFGVGPGSGSNTALPGVLPEFRANVNRLTVGPDGHIYVGGGNSPGGASSGSHGIDGTPTGALARMVANNDTVFEMKAIRSLNSTQFEIEFTEPIVSAATSNFSVGQGISTQATNTNYGAGFSGPTTTLTVSAVTLNAAKTRATLTLTGLQQRPTSDTTPGSTADRTWGSLIQIRATGLAAVSGRPMWGDGAGGGVAWYTLNKFGPGTDAGFDPVGVAPFARQAKNVEGLSFTRGSAGITVQAPVAGGYALRVSDLRGKTISTFSVTGGDFLIPAASLGGGVNVLEAKAQGGQRWITAVPKL